MSTRNHRRWAWIAIILALMLAVASSLLLTQRRPPAYRGKTVGQWVALLDSHVDYREQREEASQALAQIGAPALPELERLLSRRQNPWREIARRYAIRYRLLKPDSIHPLELQSRGCEAAYILAERANVDIHSLVPHLTYHFTNGTYADSNSGRALARSGLGGVTVLTNLLSTGSRSLRDNAGAALRHENRRPQVIAALIRSANSDPDSKIRANALLYLQRSRGPAEQLIPLGLRFLRSEDSYDRWTAAALLKDYSAEESVRKALEEARSRTNNAVQP